jgi:hypothetical protein
MNPSDLAENVLRLTLLLAGLLGPGSMVLRALRLPWSLAASFVTSGALLYVLMIGFSINGAPVALPSVGLSLVLVALLARLVPIRTTPTTISSSFACFTRLGGWTALYAAFWLIVVWRLATQPLTGPDVCFRWSWLAEQIVNSGSLDFYPPRSGGDFIRYFWAESIPPGVAGLYTWAYLCGGGTHALWTSPVVALQLLSLHELVWRLGHRWGGEVVARRAVVLAAACPLLTWSALIGQETGLTAVAVCGLAWSLAHLREADGARWAVLAGIFAVSAASTREYGIAFAFAAVLLGMLSRAPQRHGLILALVALPLALAWPLRVWWLTGNPFHSLDLAGWFPVNPGFIAWSTVFHSPHAHTLATGADWLGLGRYLLLWALPAVLGLVILGRLLIRRLSDVYAPAVLIFLSCTLWFCSLPYTAGGLFYSLRVLSPALALLAVLAAYGLTSWLPAAAHRVVITTCALLLAESLPKTLVLPQNPYLTAPRNWHHAGRQFTDSVRDVEQAMLDTFQTLPAPKQILTDNAGFPRVFARIGVEVIPLWSPDVAWLFDPNLPAEEIARRWEQSGLRYLVVGRTASGMDFVSARAQWRAPYFRVQTVAESGNNLILEVIATPPAPSP